MTDAKLTSYQQKLLGAIRKRPSGMRLSPDEVRAANELERKGLIVVEDMVAFSIGGGRPE